MATIQQEMFILNPYYGPTTLKMDVYLVTDQSFPFRAVTYNVTNKEIEEA